jgi:hypothetical protein
MDKENKIIRTGTGTGTGTEEVKTGGNEDLQRITVSKEAQNILGVITDRINDGYMGGRVNRTQMANWILMRFHSDLDEAQIKEVQVEYFDEVAMLESIFRQAKESGKVPTDFKALLQKQFGLDGPIKKKAAKALT